MNKVLVIAPHPDDEVLGCGAAIARHSALGDEVFLCVATEAYQPDWPKEYIRNKAEEIKKSNKILGFKKTFFLALPTVKLDAVPQKQLNGKIQNVVDQVKPDVLYVPFGGDLNKDHQLVYASCMVAARPVGSHNITKLLAYETLSETEWGFEQFRPNVYVDISETLEKKIKAMEAYGSELKKYPHPRSLEIIKTLAKKRGSEAGLKLAEAFMSIREIIF